MTEALLEGEGAVVTGTAQGIGSAARDVTSEEQTRGLPSHVTGSVLNVGGGRFR